MGQVESAGESPMRGDFCVSPVGAIPIVRCLAHISFGEQMRQSSSERDRRQQNRLKGVLPVRVRGTDKDGQTFDEIAHTLDIAGIGSRVGAIHHELRIADRVTVVYRQRRMEFLVVWTKLVGKHEYHVGLQALKQEKDVWGLNSCDFEVGALRARSMAQGTVT
jgi:hypothetical protein